MARARQRTNGDARVRYRAWVLELAETADRLAWTSTPEENPFRRELAQIDAGGTVTVHAYELDLPTSGLPSSDLVRIDAAGNVEWLDP